MSWAVGEREGRHIGYGVPALCDHPDCEAEIDRGISYTCGGLPGRVAACGMFFCSEHLAHFKEDDHDGGEWVCERCANALDPFLPKADVAEWVKHVLTDESWAPFRNQNADWTRRYRERAGQLGLDLEEA